MKKFWLLFAFLLPVKVHATLQDPQVVQEKTYVVHFSTTVDAAATSYFELVSLSSAITVFPHTLINPSDTGEIDVSHINCVLDKTAATTVVVRLGVVTFVNTSTGSAKYFFQNPSAKNVSNTNTLFYGDYIPTFYRCKVRPANTATNSAIDGTTPFILSNDSESGVSTFNSTTTLPSPITGTNIAPRVGDIILKVTNPSVATTVLIDLWYHAEP